MGKIQREGTDNMTGGEVTSLPPHLVGTSEAISSENLDPRSPRGATTRNGRSQHGVDNGSGTSIKGLRAWTRDNGTFFLIGRLGTTWYNISTTAWASIGIGGTDGQLSRMAALNDVLVLAVDGIAPRKYDGTTFAALGGTPPSESKFAAIFVSKVFLAGDDANPQTLTFSATNNPENYTAANDAGSITTQDGGGDTIRGLAANKKVLAIFYRNFTDILIGDSVFNFRVERLIDRGLASLTGYASAGEVVFFAGDDAIYMVAGSRVSDITTLRFRQTYDDISDKSKLSLAVKGDLLLVVDHGADVAYACAYKYNRWAKWTGQTWEVLDTGNDQTLYAGADGGSTVQVWKLDSGSLDGAATITAKWRTPNLGFGWSDSVKNLAAVKLHAKPGMGTVTITYYKNGTSIGSTTDVTFASTGDHDWAGRHGQSKVRGHFLGLQYQWSGVGTLYGWAAYAEVVTDPAEIPLEA